jgi:hypothetical protein
VLVDVGWSRQPQARDGKCTVTATWSESVETGNAIGAGSPADSVDFARALLGREKDRLTIRTPRRAARRQRSGRCYGILIGELKGASET